MTPFSKKQVIIALAIPIACLLVLASWKHMRLTQGEEIIMPIQGFDPRDLLAGHYLRYRIQYDAKDNCSRKSRSRKQEMFYCVEPSGFHHRQPGRNQCPVSIKGNCQSGRFVVENIERFYIPQEFAMPLDRAVRGRKGSLLLSVYHTGDVLVKELRIEGVPWQQWLERHQKE